MKVVKFGGSSLATGNNVNKALNIIKNDSSRTSRSWFLRLVKEQMMILK